MGLFWIRRKGERKSIILEIVREIIQVKSVSAKGALNNISWGLLDIPPKKIWSLKTATEAGSAGAPVVLIRLYVVPSYVAAWLTSSTIISFSVLLKLNISNLYLPADVLVPIVEYVLPEVANVTTLPAAATTPLLNICNPLLFFSVV